MADNSDKPAKTRQAIEFAHLLRKLKGSARRSAALAMARSKKDGQPISITAAIDADGADICRMGWDSSDPVVRFFWGKRHYQTRTKLLKLAAEGRRIDAEISHGTKRRLGR